MAIDPMVAALAQPLHDLRNSLGSGGDISTIIAAITGTSASLDDYTATARTASSQLGDDQVFVGQTGTVAADHVVSGGSAAGGLASNLDALPPILTGANGAMSTARSDLDAIIAGFESLGDAPPAQLHSAQGMAGVIAAAAGATRAALAVIGTAETSLADAVRKLTGLAPPAMPGAISPAVTAAGYAPPPPNAWPQGGQLGAAGYDGGNGLYGGNGYYSPYGTGGGWPGGANPTDPASMITAALTSAASTIIGDGAQAVGTVVDHAADGVGSGLDHIVDAGTTLIDHTAGDGATLVDHAMTGTPLPSQTATGVTGTGGGGLFGGGGTGTGAGGGAPGAPLFGGPAPAAPAAGTGNDPITGGINPAAPPIPKPPVLPPPPPAAPAAPAPVRPHHPAPPPPPATEAGTGNGQAGAGDQAVPNLGGGGQAGIGDDSTRRDGGGGTGQAGPNHGGGQAGMGDDDTDNT